MQTQNELSQFDAIKAEVIQFTAPIMTMDVVDDDGATAALTVLKQAHEYEKKIELRRTNLVKPHNDYVKRVNEYAKAISGPIEEAKTHLKRHLVTWEGILEKRRKEELARAEAERLRLEKIEMERLAAQNELNDLEAMFKAPEEIKQAEIINRVETERVQNEIAVAHKDNVKSINAQKVSGSGKRWTFEIVERDKVPFQFWMLDEKKIREAITKDGVREISGVRIFQETTISVR